MSEQKKMWLACRMKAMRGVMGRPRFPDTEAETGRLFDNEADAVAYRDKMHAQESQHPGDCYGGWMTAWFYVEASA